MKEKWSAIYKWISDNIANIYVFAMLSLYPLFFLDYYFNITKAKFYFTTIITLVGGFLFVATLKNRREKRINKLGKISIGFYLCFLVIGIVTILISDYPIHAFFGDAGRYKGWFTFFIYGLGFALILFVGKIRIELLYGMEVTACLAGLLGILNHYSIDIFGFYTNLREDQHTSFTSTFGNINVFAEYIAVMYVVSAVFYCIIDKSRWRYLHLVTNIIMCTAIITNSSDSAFVGVLLFVLLFPFAVKGKCEGERFFDVLAFSAFGSTFISCISGFVQNEKRIDGLCRVIRNKWEVVLLFGIICFIMSMAFRLIKRDKLHLIKEIYGVIFFASVLGGIILVIYINSNVAPARENTLLRLLYFNDEWGTYRGYLWGHTMEIFSDLSLREKLFGVGQDVLTFLYEMHYEETPYQITTFDNAHNIYLQILVGHGILGLFAWLGWSMSALIAAVKKMKHQRVMLVLVAGIVTYGVMGIVGLGTMHVSAIIVVLLAICHCSIEEKERNE